jgi:chaperonin cofactor prefoldin
MSELRISSFLQMLFSLENYRLHAKKLNINSEMQDMLISLYGNLLDLAKDESNPNPYGTIKEIIKQYNAVAIVAPLDNKIENLQVQIEELQSQLIDKDNKIEKLTEEIKNLYQRY